MAYETRWAVASGLWSDVNTWSHAPKSPGGSSIPVNLDYAYINSGIRVVMDVDHSVFGSGVTGVYIYGNNTGQTPGSLVFASGTNGYLKIAPNGSITGNVNNQVKGRLIANLNGEWTTNNPLPFENTAKIFLCNNAEVKGNIDIKLLASNPINPYVNIYYSGYPCIVLSGGLYSTGGLQFPNNTRVALYSDGILPSGIDNNFAYITRNRSADGFYVKLDENAGGEISQQLIINITDSGIGNLTLYTECPSGSTTLNVFKDISGDPGWIVSSGKPITTTNTLRALLVGSVTSRNQNNSAGLVLTNITPSSITISPGLPNTHYVLAKAFNTYRNVSVVISGTKNDGYIFNLGSTDVILDCEIAGDFYANTLNAINGGGNKALFKGIMHNVTRCVVINPCVFSGIAINSSYLVYHTSQNTPQSYVYGMTSCVLQIMEGFSVINPYPIVYDNAVHEGFNTYANTCNNLYIDNTLYQGFALFGSNVSLVKLGPNFKFMQGRNLQSWTGQTMLTGKCIGNRKNFVNSNNIVKDLIIQSNENAISNRDSDSFLLTTLTGNNFRLINCYYGFEGRWNGRIYNAYLNCNTIAYKYRYTDTDYLIYNNTFLASGSLLSGGLFFYDLLDSSGNIMYGRIRGFSSGGYVVTEDAPVGAPISLPYAHKFQCEAYQAYNYFDVSLIAEKNTELLIRNYIKLNSTNFTEAPNVSLLSIENRENLLSNTFAENNTNWQTIDISYTPSFTHSVILRVKAADSSKYFHWYYDIVKGYGGGGVMRNIGFTGGING